METWHWISLGVVLVGYLIGIAGIYIRNQIKINELEMKIMELSTNFRLHERLNERSFDKIEKTIQTGFDKINDRIDCLIEKIINNK